MAKISVIIPIYNIASYICKCIESVINQSFKDLEIILVDDGSTDGSGELCDIYAKKDKRIKVIHKKNEGLVRARKDGLRNSHGQYILFVDGDDWLEPQMIECLYNTAMIQNVDVAMCGRFEDTGDVSKPVCHGISEGRYDKQALIRNVYPNMIVNNAFFEWGIFPSLWDKMFKRECVEKFLMSVDDNITMGEDAACVYPCLLNVNSIYVIGECLYHYRQSSTSMVKGVTDIDLERYRFNVLYNTVAEKLKKYVKIYDLESQWIEYLLFLMVPRADNLYQGIEKLDFIFPFSKVKKGSKIIIYGAGTYGQRLYRYLKQTNFCSVEALVDRNYYELNKQGVPAVAPEEITKYDYDAIVVASSFAKTRKAIYQYLITVFSKEKVHVMDETLIKSEDTMKAFGLI